MSQHRSIEVKVGILILTSLGLLAGFIIVMGGLSFEPSYTVHVDFANPGGLKAGAPVRLAGLRIGKVSSIEFRGDTPDAAARGMLVRVVTQIEHSYSEALHEDSKWFISTQGVLGEFFLAVEPGTPESPPLKDGEVVEGISPPRLDLLLSETYELLHHAYTAITRNEEQLKETFDGLHRTLRGSGHFFERNAEKIDRLVDSAETLTEVAAETLSAAREKYVNNPKIDHIISNLERTTTSLDSDLKPLLRDSRALVTNLSRASEVLADERQLQQYRQITQDVAVAARDTRKAVASTNALLAHVQAGKGSLGALMIDETVYDDLQEFLRDLKHNPWKLLWRE